LGDKIRDAKGEGSWHIWRRRKIHRVMAVHPGLRWSLGRFMSIWKDNIKMDIKEAGRAWNGLMWHRLRTSSGLW
jgi:hypothetical protein